MLRTLLHGAAAGALLLSLTMLLARLGQDGGVARAARPARLAALSPHHGGPGQLRARPGAAAAGTLPWAALALVAWVALVVSLDAGRP